MSLSFWEKTTFFAPVDVAVIGSGLVGLTAAIALKEKRPHLNITVLERGVLPSGASTKNAGFACMGSPSELLYDLTQQTENEVFTLFEQRWKGLQKLRQRIGDKHLDYQHFGGYEIFTERNQDTFNKCEKALPYLNQQIQQILPEKEYFSIKNGLIQSFGFEKVQQLIHIKGEGQIDTGKMMRRLINLALERGITILNGIEVEAIEDDAQGATVYLKNNAPIKAERILVATNGLSKRLLPLIEVSPARNQVLITKPLKKLPFQGAFHMDEGYYYFRNIGDRILFGGGRNLDFTGETTDEFGTTRLITDNLSQLLKTHILPTTPHEIDYFWSGILGVGSKKIPLIQKLSSRITVAIRLGGIGIAIGSLVGEEGAKVCLEG